MPRPPDEKAKPPDTTEQILDKILSTDRLILLAVSELLVVEKEQLDVSKESLQVQKRELHVANETLEAEKKQIHIASKSLELDEQQAEIEQEQLEVLREILASLEQPPSTHNYTLEVKKEKPLMPVQPGIATAFSVTMSDNGNPITPPSGTVYGWLTDDATDVITDNSSDGSASKVTVQTTDPPAAGRTSISITASAADPAGDTITDTLTTDILPGVAHTYTLTVNQDFVSSQPPMIPLPKPGGGRLPNKGGGKK